MEGRPRCLDGVHTCSSASATRPTFVFSPTCTRNCAPRPALPLFLAERSSRALSNIAYWGSWDKPDALPRFEQVFSPDGSSREPSPHVLSKRAFLNITVAPGTRTADASTRADLAARLNEPGGNGTWDGGVLDLSEWPLAKAAALLEPAPPQH